MPVGIREGVTVHIERVGLAGERCQAASISSAVWISSMLAYIFSAADAVRMPITS